MVASIHPSQKRFSCETCRNHKLRCLRQESDDSKCSRCARLGMVCVSGQQRRVGRPRRQAPAGGPRVDQGGEGSLQANEALDGTEPPEFNSGPNVALESAGRSGVDVESSWAQAFYPTQTVDSLEVRINTSTAAIAEFPLEIPGVSTSWDTNNGLFNASSLGITTPTCCLSAVTPSSESVSSTTAPLEDRSFVFDIQEPLLSARAVTSHQAMSKLSKLATDLYARTAIAETHHGSIDLHHIICHDSIFGVDNLSLVEFMLRAGQDFLQVLTNLRMSPHVRGLLCAPQPVQRPYPGLAPSAGWTRDVSVDDDNQTPAASIDPSALAASQPLSPTTYGTRCNLPPIPSSPEPISASLALIITSIYIQLISLYEIILLAIIVRLDRLHIEAIRPIERIQFGGVPLSDSYTQGMVFLQIVVSLLERMERSLGIGMVPAGATPGLLSKRQQDVLFGELDRAGGDGDGKGTGKGRIVRVREEFERVRGAFVEGACFE